MNTVKNVIRIAFIGTLVFSTFLSQRIHVFADPVLDGYVTAELTKESYEDVAAGIMPIEQLAERLGVDIEQVRKEDFRLSELEVQKNTSQISGTPGSNQGSTPGPIKVYTSEIIPGADCNCDFSQTSVNEDGSKDTSKSIIYSDIKKCPDYIPVYQRKYVCTVQPGLGSFQSMFRDIIKYFVNIVLILGVLAIVGLGIAWSFSGGDDAKAKSTLKKWGINILVGLIILFMFQYILRFLAPWIYQ